jgi:hypothetical protein
VSVEEIERIALKLFYKNMRDPESHYGVEERELIFEWSADPLLRNFWIEQVEFVLEEMGRLS